MALGRVGEGEGGQAALQVQAQMTLGGGLAPAMPGPVQTGGHQLEGGGAHGVEGAVEAVKHTGVE